MRSLPAFLTVDQVLIVHQRMIAEFGGDSGIRGRGILESAVAMPAARFGGRLLHASVPDMAAAYLFHLCKNHAFVDGNKRTALACAELFLLLNGKILRAPSVLVVRLVRRVASGAATKAEVVTFFRAHTRRGN